MIKSAFYERVDNAKCYFSCYGSFGDMSGEFVRNEGEISLKNEKYTLSSVFSEDKNGVITRQDSFTNTSIESLELRRLKSRFVFEGGEYSVYSQFNTWQNESTGLWQPLNTSVCVFGTSTRVTQDATPFVAIWNEQAKRGFAFHLLPASLWEIKVTRIGNNSKHTKILVELGISDYNFNLSLSPGESVEMPKIIAYEFKNKLDMDCHKLHKYMNSNHPRKTMPIIYNSWMSRFDDISYEKLAPQATIAAELGVEYFVIDAGWFGDGAPWSESVGDWVENQSSAMAGRMGEFADFVRSTGMKFGLWMEPERALPGAKAVKEHPEFYLEGDAEPEFLFLNFADDKAREWITEKICSLIDKYGIEFIKDDYNADLCFDKTFGGFIEYHKGYKKYISDLREKYPNLYISCCGSGGERTELRNSTIFDSFWPSDNESPYTQFRIYKDTILRLPPQCFERWLTIHSANENEGVYAPFVNYNGGESERLIASADAIWHNVVGVQPSFLFGFATAGPVAFSCDLTKISEKSLKKFKDYISFVKKNRDYLMKVSAYILADTRSETVIEYADDDFDRVTVQIFTKEPMQSTFYVYPKVDSDADYIFDGKRISGRDITEYGIKKNTDDLIDNWHEMIEIVIEKG